MTERKQICHADLGPLAVDRHCTRAKGHGGEHASIKDDPSIAEGCRSVLDYGCNRRFPCRLAAGHAGNHERQLAYGVVEVWSDAEPLPGRHESPPRGLVSTEADRARTFLLSFSEPGKRNRPADLVLRALGAIAAAFREFEHGEPEKKP